MTGVGYNYKNMTKHVFKEIECKICSFLFVPWSSKTRICMSCRIRECQECGTLFIARATQLDISKYCSTDCREKNPIAYWKGKNLTEVAKQKMSEKHKILAQQGIVPPSWLGKKRRPKTTEELENWKKMMKEKNFIGENHPNWKGGKPKCVDCGTQLVNIYAKRCMSCREKALGPEKLLKARQIMHNLREPTSIEKAVYDFLTLNRINFEKEKLINNKFFVDVFVPDLNLIIEVDGKYWHSLERVIKLDKAKNAYLIKCGYDLLRIPEEKIRNKEFEQILKNRLKGQEWLY